jgi:hypothetical protein
VISFSLDGRFGHALASISSPFIGHLGLLVGYPGGVDAHSIFAGAVVLLSLPADATRMNTTAFNATFTESHVSILQLAESSLGSGARIGSAIAAIPAYTAALPASTDVLVGAPTAAYPPDLDGAVVAARILVTPLEPATPLHLTEFVAPAALPAGGSSLLRLVSLAQQAHKLQYPTTALTNSAVLLRFSAVGDMNCDGLGELLVMDVGGNASATSGTGTLVVLFSGVEPHRQAPAVLPWVSFRSVSSQAAWRVITGPSSLGLGLQPSGYMAALPRVPDSSLTRVLFGTLNEVLLLLELRTDGSVADVTTLHLAPLQLTVPGATVSSCTAGAGHTVVIVFTGTAPGSSASGDALIALGLPGCTVAGVDEAGGTGLAWLRGRELSHAALDVPAGATPSPGTRMGSALASVAIDHNHTHLLQLGAGPSGASLQLHLSRLQRATSANGASQLMGDSGNAPLPGGLAAGDCLALPPQFISGDAMDHWAGSATWLLTCVRPSPTGLHHGDGPHYVRLEVTWGTSAATSNLTTTLTSISAGQSDAVGVRVPTALNRAAALVPMPKAATPSQCYPPSADRCRRTPLLGVSYAARTTGGDGPQFQQLFGLPLQLVTSVPLDRPLALSGDPIGAAASPRLCTAASSTDGTSRIISTHSSLISVRPSLPAHMNDLSSLLLPSVWPGSNLAPGSVHEGSRVLLVRDNTNGTLAGTAGPPMGEWFAVLLAADSGAARSVHSIWGRHVPPPPWLDLASPLEWTSAGPLEWCRLAT